MSAAAYVSGLLGLLGLAALSACAADLSVGTPIDSAMADGSLTNSGSGDTLIDQRSEGTDTLSGDSLSDIVPSSSERFREACREACRASTQLVCPNTPSEEVCNDSCFAAGDRCSEPATVMLLCLAEAGTTALECHPVAQSPVLRETQCAEEVKAVIVCETQSQPLVGSERGLMQKRSWRSPAACVLQKLRWTP